MLGVGLYLHEPVVESGLRLIIKDLFCYSHRFSNFVLAC